MSVIATIEVAAEDFTLGGALATNPDVQVSLERVIPLGSTFIPYLWVDAASLSAVEDALATEGDIASFTVVDRVENEALIRLEWHEDMDGLIEAMADSQATILEATGRGEGWSFQLRFPSDDHLTDFYRRCVDDGVSIDLQRVHHPGLPEDIGIGFGLTETQQSTLRYALEAGYFDVPRRINLVDLSDELGISDTATSQRIRRGISTVLGATLIPASNEEESET